MIVYEVVRLLRISMHRLRLIVLLIIIVALAIPLGQIFKSPEPPHSEHTSKGMSEQTPSAASNTKHSTLQITSPLPTTNRCATPISLRVGQIDEQFNIDATALTTALENAAHEWNTATGRTLFVVRGDGDVAVNLLFDGRQDSVNQLAGEEREISALSQNLSARLQAHASRLERHKSAVAEWNRETKTHNKLVEMINVRSDSLVENPEDYVALQAERQRIYEMGVHLNEAKRYLVRQRELIIKGTSDLEAERESFKARIRALRGRFSSNVLPDGEHRRGLSVNEINVYTFYNLETFHVVLLHEMGHALGLPHIDEQPAIMYPIIEHGSELSHLTPLDIQAAQVLCRF